MFARCLVVLIVIATTTSSQATNRSYWDLWALDVGMICFAQNSTYRNTPLGHMVAKSYTFSGWRAFDRMPSVACLRSRQWVSDSLCADVTRLDEKTFRDLGPLFRKYDTELQGLKDVIVYQYESRTPKGASLPCPVPK